jgi:hypothetical protein
MTEFEKQLEHIINCHSIENESNTPDFILAEYLRGCLDVFAKTVTAREKWYGREPKFLATTEVVVQLSPQDEGLCYAREDEQHCNCWWDGNACCSCGHPAVLKSLDNPE